MKTLQEEELAHLTAQRLTAEGPVAVGSPYAIRTASDGQLAELVANATGRTRQWLLREQEPAGHWCGELEGDSILSSEYVLLLAFLRMEHTPEAQKCAARLLKLQRPDGGWGMYPNSPIDISASVKAYFALKLTGHDVHTPYMDRARKAILAAGGADRVNSFTRFYLAILGQIDFSLCPAVPPEMTLLPKWFPINIYKMSAWTRTIVVPLSILWAKQPVRELAAGQSITELWVRSPQHWPALRNPAAQGKEKVFGWERFFRITDRFCKLLERRKLTPLRRRAVESARQWMLERFEQSDGLGAIFPPIVWSIIALKALGYNTNSPEIQQQLRHLRDLMIEEDGEIRIQPCQSPVWDTALTLRGLAATGEDPHGSTSRRAVQWLLSKEVTQRGDWTASAKTNRPGGWCFEYNNAFYPDVDDTAMVLLALRDQFDILPPEEEPSREQRTLLAAGQSSSGLAGSNLPVERIATFERITQEKIDTPEGPAVVLSGKISAPQVAGNQVPAKNIAALHAVTFERVIAAGRRGLAWMLSMQNRDGGWGAFDRNNNWSCLTSVPFADHNAMIDPSTPDLTGRALEALGRWHIRQESSAVRAGIAYLRKTQEADGSWQGRWGVNYIYGTWQVLAGLAAVGVPTSDPMMQSGSRWLLGCQQADGGWGESPATYADPALRGKGIVTASQTAWAILGLIAAGLRDHAAVANGIRYLLQTQSADGSWAETEFTGTGFPLVFYLRYHLYPLYFPLLALGHWQGKK